MGSTKTSRGFFARNRSVFVLGLSALIIAATADLFAGLFLKSMEAYILAVPGMMVLIYSAIGMRGNIYGAMGSRIVRLAAERHPLFSGGKSSLGL